MFQPNLLLLTLISLLATSLVFAQSIVFSDVDYISDLDYDGGRDLLDIYMPEKADMVPVIVFFHGGALLFGSKAQGEVVASRLNPKGIGLVAANYRLSPVHMHPAHVQDAAAATAWVVENIQRYGGDPDNVYVAGHSAGAYLATLLAVDLSYLTAYDLSSNSIRGAIPISPFLYVEETAADRPKTVWGEDPKNWLEASVTPHIRKNDRRMLLIYADGDVDWRKQQNDRFGEAMTAAGNEDVRVVEVPNREHKTLISNINDTDDQIGDLIARFVQER
jgi:acetyl esterase/lipase